MERPTRRQILRWAGVGSMTGIPGCSGIGGSRSKNPDPIPTTAQETFRINIPKTNGCPEGTTNTDPPNQNEPVVSIQAQTDHYYDGPLFLSHEHFHADFPIPEWNWGMTSQCLPWYLDFMNRNNISTVIPFVASHQLPMLQEHPDRFAPFLFGPVPGALRYDEIELSEWPAAFDQLLAAESAWEGIGEFGLYRIQKGATEINLKEGIAEQPIPADHPVLGEVYDVAAEHNAVVMLHPFTGRQLGERDRETPLETPEVQALERAFENHRETTFLIHGLQPVGEWIASLLEEHPNWYYDVSGVMTPHAWSSKMGGGPPVDYDEHMTPDHIMTHAQEAYETWEAIFRRAPERVVVGFDLSLPWHLNTHVLDSWVETFRGVLGHLPESDAAKIGHQNAERMLISDSTE